jgi:hypothetical protein
MYRYIYVCMYVYIYTYIYVYISILYTYIPTRAHTHIHIGERKPVALASPFSLPQPQQHDEDAAPQFPGSKVQSPDPVSGERGEGQRRPGLKEGLMEGEEGGKGEAGEEGGTW